MRGMEIIVGVDLGQDEVMECADGKPGILGGPVDRL